MASSKEYLEFVLEQLSEVEDVSSRAMMGEYILYHRGKVFGGVYDNRFLVKPTKSAVALMPHAERALPYPGAKEMLLVDNVEDKAFLRDLLEAMQEELPTPKKKTGKQDRRDEKNGVMDDSSQNCGRTAGLLEGLGADGICDGEFGPGQRRAE